MPPSTTQNNPDLLMATMQETLAVHQMLAPGDRVLVGVSGGPDSMALLHLLSRMAAERNIRLGVAHLNHCLRGAAADKDANVVRRAAAALKHPCYMVRAQVMKVKRKLGLSLEEAGRRVRYAFFKKTMANAGYNKLALGHHADDNAEQMLMALLRGTGLRGLSGIVPVRGNRIIRPLINASRSQIEAFIHKEGIACVTDASNDDLRFVRNRVRKRLLPMLAAEYNPRISDHLNRLADVARTDAAWTDELAAAEYERVVRDRGKNDITLSVGAMNRAHSALARRLVRVALQDLTGSLRRISFSHVQSVLHLLKAGCDEKKCHLPGGIRIHRSDDRLILRVVPKTARRSTGPTTDRQKAATTVIATPLPASVDIKEMGIGLLFSSCRPDQLPRWERVDHRRVHFDLARLSLPLTVRPAIPGDRFTPLGSSGSKKLKKFFIDQRIPRKDRAMVPVLSDQQRIIWLVGQRMDDRVKVTATTSQVLRVEFFLLDT